jgi:hypothetical protein
MMRRVQCRSGSDRAAAYQASSNLDRNPPLAHFVHFGIANCLLSKPKMNLQYAKLSDCEKESRFGRGGR